MTIVSPSPAIMPSILSMVKRVKRECGLPEPTTLVATTDKQSIVVLDALNDASNDIYHRRRWEWNESLYGITLVSGTSQYALPADFMRMAKDPKTAGYIVQPMDENDFHSQLTNSTTTTGSPLYYSVHGYIFEMWPTPSDSYIASYPILQFTYYRLPPSRLDGTDDSANINIPPQFEECLISFGKWKLKQLLEYPDANDERMRYEQCLQLQMNSDRSMRPMQRIKLPYNPKIWN